MWFYTILHPEAKLSSTEKQELVSGLEKTFGLEVEKKGEKQCNRELFPDTSII